MDLQRNANNVIKMRINVQKFYQRNELLTKSVIPWKRINWSGPTGMIVGEWKDDYQILLHPSKAVRKTFYHASLKWNIFGKIQIH